MNSKWALVPVAVVVTVGLTLGVLGLGDGAYLGIGAILALAALIIIPKHLLPSLALVLWVLVPRRLFEDVGPLALVFPVCVVMLIWGIREALSKEKTRSRLPAKTAIATIFVLALLWFLVSTVIGQKWGDSLSWVIAFAALALLPTLFADVRATNAARATMLVLVAITGAYALVEYLLGANLIYDPIYALLGQPEVQNWSVYRSHSTFGHPLYASFFLAAGFALALGTALERPRFWPFAVAAIAGIGVVTTVSRGGLAAVAASAVVVILLVVFRSDRVSGVVKFLTIAATAVGMFVALQSDAFSERSSSSEAGSSADARTWIFELAYQSANDTYWLGSGPATSADTVRALNSYQILVENGYLQILISAGLPALILFLAILGVSAVQAIRAQRYAGLSVLVAFSTAIFGFNGLESNASIFLVLGFGLMLIWVPEVVPPAVPDAAEALHVKRVDEPRRALLRTGGAR
ncbi:MULTISPECIES: O-antigen ligase family protein [unclassified Pseudoclavibacter]|uniref:O-antigen ligase family protein n=1 Tax=unclassified Pseudoclavibacter TaxID=2615177 RepID=UPI001BA74C43|nr:O-antigen ligase family protein [Pseudoclavibacter sp. Marseille-Q4354]MBS3180071.1 O-antigen ligase family protein [Pseudoclavibacter sp. Marseille-Q4354]